MRKNIFYSIFLHLALGFFLFFTFSFEQLEDEEPQVTVSFEVDSETAIKPQELPQAPEIKAEEKKPEVKEEKKPLKKEEKKPEIKKEEKKPEIKKEEKKPDVKTIAKKEDIKAPEAPKIKEEPKTKEEKPAEKKEENIVKIAPTKSVPTLENTIEQLNLSAREKFNIQSQLRRCYKKAIAENKGVSDILVTVKISISQDGYVKSNLDEIIDQDLYKNPTAKSYKTAIDNARSAIRFCNPLRNLPADKYDTWKDITLQFDGKND